MSPGRTERTENTKKATRKEKSEAECVVLTIFNRDRKADNDLIQNTEQYARSKIDALYKSIRKEGEHFFRCLNVSKMHRIYLKYWLCPHP